MKQSETQFIVKFKDGTTSTQIESLNQKYSSREIKSLQKGAFTMDVPSGRSVDEMISLYSQDSNVEYVEPDYVMTALSTTTDPHYSSQVALETMNVVSSWSIEPGEASVVVAVIDTGVLTTHADLAGQCTAGYDYVNSDSDPTDIMCFGFICPRLRPSLIRRSIVCQA
ncbi:MAG: hypothetical protein HGA22_13630, partial [Clostridiales bacterium]|nr:hypothetical protein [Clostridiales bacterium]